MTGKHQPVLVTAVRNGTTWNLQEQTLPEMPKGFGDTSNTQAGLYSLTRLSDGTVKAVGAFGLTYERPGSGVSKQAVTTTWTLPIGSSTMLVQCTPGNTRRKVPLDAPACIGAGSRTLVPIRAVVEALGGTATWNASTKEATVHLGDVMIVLTIGNSNATVNGGPVRIDADQNVVPVVVADRTMLPLRFVAEELGAAVDWDSSTQIITITYQT